MKKKALIIMNIALVLTAIVLILHLFEVELPTLGKAQYWLDESEPVCVTSFGDQKSLLDMGSCCYGLQMQLNCKSWRTSVVVGGEKLMVDKRCYVGEEAVEYFMNMKAYNLCKKEGYLDYKVI